eukprot:TRINITY_DN1813_c2_g1_i2.p2 TRINITY_DN1813_c2_g1~~TRINITY_DN1813_c2_g1_i2.p2  ORF type:complete len:210 (+),score=58.53 TRINITY_DN1813_c2_g1_i2:71-631(+)
MGAFLSLERLFARFGGRGRRDARVLMVGLDAAGKTTVLYQMKLNEAVETVPTIGFNIETVRAKSLTLTIYDLGGQDKLRPLWRVYHQSSEGVIFVVDSHDADRMAQAREELHNTLASDLLAGACLLVLANKQDLPVALGPAEVTERLGLPRLSSRNWHLQPCCAATGEGLSDGLGWLAAAIRRQRQ